MESELFLPCFLCGESYTVFVYRHATIAPTHTIHKTCCHSTNSHNTQDMLPQHQQTQYTRHAATAPTHTIHKTCYHSTNSHNTQDMLPQHQPTQYTRHAATAPTHTIHKTCCHNTNSHNTQTCCHNNSHNTQDMLPQHQIMQYTRRAATAPTQCNNVNHRVFLNYNFSKEQYKLPEDDSMIETCRRVLSAFI